MKRDPGNQQEGQPSGITATLSEGVGAATTNGSGGAEDHVLDDGEDDDLRLLVEDSSRCQRHCESFDQTFWNQQRSAFWAHTWLTEETPNPQGADGWKQGEVVLINYGTANDSDMRLMVTTSDSAKRLVPAHACPTPGTPVALNSNVLNRVLQKYEANLMTSPPQLTLSKLLGACRYTALAEAAALTRGGQDHGTAGGEGVGASGHAADVRPWAEVPQQRHNQEAPGRQKTEAELLDSPVTAETGLRHDLGDSVLPNAYETALHTAANSTGVGSAPAHIGLQRVGGGRVDNRVFNAAGEVVQSGRAKRRSQARHSRHNGHSPCSSWSDVRHQSRTASRGDNSTKPITTLETAEFHEAEVARSAQLEEQSRKRQIAKTNRATARQASELRDQECPPATLHPLH